MKIHPYVFIMAKKINKTPHTMPIVKIIPGNMANLQVLKQMQAAYENKYAHSMSQVATVTMFMASYLVSRYDGLEKLLDGESCEFSRKLRKHIKNIADACDKFIKDFEPLIDEDSKKEWCDGSGPFFEAMDNFFILDTDFQYDEKSDGERAKEIVRASWLRYADPYETNMRRIFMSGFRQGAAYADLHPIKRRDGQAK